MHLEFLDEDIMTLFEKEVEDDDKDKWIVWFDGASNAPGHGVRVVLVTPDDQCIPFMAREENQMADALATLVSMFQLTPHRDLSYIEFRCHGKPAHYFLIEEEQDGKPWYFDVKLYIEDKKYPLEASDIDKRMLRRLAAGFFLSRNIMYKGTMIWFCSDVWMPRRLSRSFGKRMREPCICGSA
ncbi:hypothetical protein GmHk_04G010521 [Glycine max]|nr:hypothetical protein GmHk_04G010521 [Glycine max]